MSRVVFERISLPSFGGFDDDLPEIPIAEYRARLAQATERLKPAGFDALVVYADREHSANLAFLTGFDPRFEEAIFLINARGERLLLMGNECMGYQPDGGVVQRGELFQELSLLGQPRETSRPLRKIVSDFGIGKGSRVGVAGWKYFTGSSVEGGEHALETPSYLVDLLRDLVGDRSLVRNAGRLFMDCATGLRATNSAMQIARFEWAAIRSSEGVHRVVEGIRPGVAERNLEHHMDAGGLPLSCHRMVGFGEKAKRGLASASGRKANIGDAYTAAMGVEGSLTARAGVIAAGPADLALELRDAYPRFVAAYFTCAAAWYAALRVGSTGGQVFAAVESSILDRSVFTLALNPGHLIHLDEWLNSPFAAGDTTPLRSGMAIQADLIPISHGLFCTSNVEDGVVLADEPLRTELAARFPALWRRVEQRRAFMRDAIGVTLDPSVLPLSNTPMWLPAYALDSSRVPVVRG